MVIKIGFKYKQIGINIMTSLCEYTVSNRTGLSENLRLTENAKKLRESNKNDQCGQNFKA